MKIKNLKRARIDSGKTQVQLANEIEVSRSMYSRYESGVRIPSVATLTRIAKALNVSLDYLILGNKKEKK